MSKSPFFDIAEACLPVLDRTGRLTNPMNKNRDEFPKVAEIPHSVCEHVYKAPKEIHVGTVTSCIIFWNCSKCGRVEHTGMPPVVSDTFKEHQLIVCGCGELIPWGSSSAGERQTDNLEVAGSTPACPTNLLWVPDSIKDLAEQLREALTEGDEEGAALYAETISNLCGKITEEPPAYITSEPKYVGEIPPRTDIPIKKGEL